METKSDGRLYSKILRRSVAIFQYIAPTRIFTIKEIAEEISSNNVPEFFLTNLNRTIKPRRIADYLRYLVAINAFIGEKGKYKLAFTPKTIDKDWVIEFSDLAWNYLALQSKTTPVEFTKKLKEILTSYHSEQVLPMIPDIVEEFQVESGYREEFFRWGLYMFTDSETCPFDIRRFPIVVEKKG